ncbi:MAG: COX15/CtaA family protein [Microbacteriaceae bacterium]
MKRSTARWRSFINWLPDQVDGRVRGIAWLSLIFQIILIGTGGTVRLTGSGLGCPTWPRCTADSLVNVPEQGIHGVIEFGNRLLAVLLGVIAVIAVIAVLRLRRQYPRLLTLAVLLLAGIPAQAVLGGISVLSQLNPYVVGLHFVASIALVVLATVFVYLVYPHPPAGAVPSRMLSGLAWITSFFVGVTILVGILTTGSGPHAGDAKAPRTGLDTVLMEHLHSYPAYAVVALTIMLVLAAFRFPATEIRRFAVALLAVESVQVAVGLIQARTGLPVALVNIHMVLASVLAAFMTAVVLSIRHAGAGRDQNRSSGSMPTATKSSVK